MPASRDIVVLGASAGGIEALSALLAAVPEDLDAAVFVVVHMPTTGGSALSRILDHAGPLPAAAAEDGEPIRPGRVYVAPADHHLLVSGDVVLARRGPRENGHRPAIDPLFRSAARWFGARVIGGVLSGTLDDGAAGLSAVKRQGGLTVVQDPADARFADMPRVALARIDADLVAPAAELGRQLAVLVCMPAPEGPRPTPTMIEEVQLMETLEPSAPQDERPGAPSQWGCPDCGGVLWHI
jgi:two-component system chemotaxis response regulator CheB